LKSSRRGGLVERSTKHVIRRDLGEKINIFRHKGSIWNCIGGKKKGEVGVLVMSILWDWTKISTKSGGGDQGKKLIYGCRRA